MYRADRVRTLLSSFKREMTAKDFLRQYEEAERLVLRLKTEYQEETEQIDSIRSSVGDGTPHGSAISKTVEIRAMKLATKALEWKQAELDAVQIRQEIVKVINMIPGEKGDVLYQRYINLKTWDDVADAVGYTKRHVHRIHGDALKAVQDVIVCHSLK